MWTGKDKLRRKTLAQIASCEEAITNNDNNKEHMKWQFFFFIGYI